MTTERKRYYYINRKEVRDIYDSDPNATADYTWMYDLVKHAHVFFYGYSPMNPFEDEDSFDGWEDWVCDSMEEAIEWFDDYDPISLGVTDIAITFDDDDFDIDDELDFANCFDDESED